MSTSEERIQTVLINKSKLLGQSLGIYLTKNIDNISIVGIYQDAVSAYNVLETERIDLLIIDMALEGESAQNAIMNLKEFFPDIYVIGIAENMSLKSIKVICDAGTNELVFKHLKTVLNDLLKAITTQFKSQK